MINEKSYTLNSEIELKDFLCEHPKAVVVFGKPDCLHCGVVETIFESVLKDYPLIAFAFTTSQEIAEKRHIESFPVTCFYEDTHLQGCLVGSGFVEKTKEILNVWVAK